MTGASRRDALRLALCAAVAPMVASRAMARQQDIAGGLIAPPVTPMRYTRVVERDMVDGQVFRVTRDFEVEFRRFDAGFMLHGAQTGVATQCPDALQRFADLEAARDESALFPIALDPLGTILSAGPDPLSGEHVGDAIEEALAVLAAQPIPAVQRDMLRDFVAALHIVGQRITAHMPADLFAPAEPSRTDEQIISLPGGGEGLIRTEFTGETDTATGLLRRASRSIVTQAGDSRRTTGERWSLTPA